MFNRKFQRLSVTLSRLAWMAQISGGGISWEMGVSRRSKKCAAAAVVMLGSERAGASGGSDTPLHLYENGFTGRLRREESVRVLHGREGRAR